MRAGRGIVSGDGSRKTKRISFRTVKRMGWWKIVQLRRRANSCPPSHGIETVDLVVGERIAKVSMARLQIDGLTGY